MKRWFGRWILGNNNVLNTSRKKRKEKRGGRFVQVEYHAFKRRAMKDQA
jgi:hypothetical protein